MAGPQVRRNPFGVMLLVGVLGCGGGPKPSEPDASFACAVDPAVADAGLRESVTSLCAGGLPAGAVRNALAQYHAWGPALTAGCPAQLTLANGRGRFFMSPPCSEVATAQGFFEDDATMPFVNADGTLHDGDTGGNLCPTFMAAVDPHLKLDSIPAPVELRADEWNNGTLHLEWDWCRHFTGKVAIPEELDGGVPIFPSRVLDFSPHQGDQLAATGEWLMDFASSDSVSGVSVGGKGELHEVWMYAARERDVSEGGSDPWDAGTPPVLAPGVGHPIDFRVSAQFPVDLGTPTSRPFLEVLSAVPPRHPAEASFGKLSCTPKPVIPSDGGCSEPGVDATLSVLGQPDPAHPTPLVFRVELPASHADLLNQYECSGRQCAGCNDLACVTQQISEHTACQIATDERPAFSGVFRCSWQDPLDLWECGSCACDDPSQQGASIAAPVLGCAPEGLDPSNPADRQAACAAVCNGLICGTAPACRIEQCRAPLTSTPEARLIARQACAVPLPPRRVAPVGDYRVDFGSGSKLHFGFGDPLGDISTFVEVASTDASATAYLDIAPSTDPAVQFIQLAHLELAAQPFSYPTFGGFPPQVTQHDVKDETAVLLLRAAGTLKGTAVDFPAGSVRIAGRATVDNQPGGTELVSQGPIDGTLDLATGEVALEGAGVTSDGTAATFQLKGQIANRPPVANAGPDRTFECTSPAGASVTLDASLSSDPDPGDALTHFQWFERLTQPEPSDPGQLIDFEVPRGNTPSLTTVAALGDHFYELHVYDEKLGSAAGEVKVGVVDTTPPALAVSPSGLCVWPPNHDFMFLRLGQEIQFSVHDACDPTPRVEILDVVSDEPALVAGSGNTTPDVVFGKTSACVRAERSGTGTGRHYTVTLRATDASGNSSIASIHVLVPHDSSGHLRCVPATGMKQPDDRCVQ